MKPGIEIDERSGFCNGVVRAVEKAESYLKSHDRLYSLGDIVHNSLELGRLKKSGLEILTIAEVRRLHNDTVLIRAHGEPPRTYEIARQNNLNLIDCTCPVVLQLQKKVKETFLELSRTGGQVVIFGKRGHAEVNGLVGQTDGSAIVIDSVESASRLDLSKPTALFSQTTKDPSEYARIAEYIRSHGKDVKVFDTICKQVANRHNLLRDFATGHSVIIFVSGRESSNGKVLFELCKSVNERSHWVENPSQIDRSWFNQNDSIGICGATSTPKWQLEEIFLYLHKIFEY